MLVLELIALSGISYVGSRFAKRKKNKDKHTVDVQKKVEDVQQTTASHLVAPVPVTTPARLKRDMRLSGASLGLTVSGFFLGAPLLGLMSIPSLISVSMPTFRAALNRAREGRVDDETHKAVRIIFCLATGLLVVAAVDLTLQTAIKRRVMQSEADFKKRLGVILGQPAESVWVLQDGGAELEVPLYQVENGATVVLMPGDTAPFSGTVVGGDGRIRPVLATDTGGEEIHTGDVVPAGFVVTEGNLEVKLDYLPMVLPDLRQELEHAADGKTTLVKLGEQSGSRLAPWMMGAFVAGLPFMGFSRSAVFLTARLGQQMDQLGPHTARQAITAGLEHGIFIRDLTALERATRVNTIVFDAALLNHASARSLISSVLASLRRRQWPVGLNAGVPRQFALYAMADSEDAGQELLDTFGFDDYFKEPLEWGRTRLINGLQQAGRNVCYIGLPGKSEQTLQQASVSVTWCPDGLPQPSPASILLGGEHLPDLATLFDLAQAFTTRQSNSFLRPLGVDFLNLSVNTFLSYGLLSSVVLTNAVSLLDVSGSGFVKREWDPPREPTDDAMGDTPQSLKS